MGLQGFRMGFPLHFNQIQMVLNSHHPHFYTVGSEMFFELDDPIFLTEVQKV